MIRSAFSMTLSLMLTISIFGFVGMGLIQVGLGKETMAHRYDFAPWLQLSLAALGVSAILGIALNQFCSKRSGIGFSRFETAGAVIFGFCFLAAIFLITISFFTGLGRAV